MIPACWLNIWPADGGRIALSSLQGSILRCSTRTDIWSGQGSFTVELAPGGPYGPNAGPSWADVITPMSLVLIGLERGQHARTVMIGVVTEIQETERWQAATGVRRAVRITGQDFNFFLNERNAYSQLFTSLSGAGLLGQSGAASAALDLGLQGGTLAFCAQQFFSKVMAGTGGLLSGTNFAYQSGQVSFNDLVATSFGAYPGLDLEIPSAMNFLALDGTWRDTFLTLYTFPWFEFFIQTCQAGDYGIAAPKSSLTLTDRATLPAAFPALIARALPIPTLSAIGTLDMGRWNALPVYQPGLHGGTVAKNLRFAIDELRNAYFLNPIYLGTMNGGSNSGITPWLYQYGGFIDNNSIKRYGYRPRIDNVSWFADPVGQQAQRNAGQSAAFAAMVNRLMLVPPSYHEPVGAMRGGATATMLRPDILPGGIWRSPIDKTNAPWDFYIRGVEHDFNFGGQSVSTLSLARGLPSAVYSDSALLAALLGGNARRVDGSYMAGLPAGAAAPLQSLNIGSAFSDLSDLAGVFGTPGRQ